MAILQITTDFAGEIGVVPRLVRVQSTDSLAAITTAGYLNGAEAQGITIAPTDVIFVSYLAAGAVEFGIFQPTFSNGIITLTQNESSVVLPVIDNHFAIWSGTGGALKGGAATAINSGNIQAGLSGTSGILTSFPATASKGSLHVTAVANTGNTVTTISNAAMGQASTVSVPDPGASTANFIVSAIAGAGTQSITTGSLAVTTGNLSAGSSGAAGTVSSFSSTAARGSLRMAAVANAGNTITTISNAAMGQASVVSIPDPAGATANFVVAPAALVSGNLVKASGTAGLVVDAGARLIANTTGTYAGGGTTNTFAATGLTSAAKGSAVIRTSTNSVAITKALPGTDTLAITFSADPGAGTTVDYIYATASQA